MYSFSTYKDQYKSNLKLALPVVLTQLGQILTQVADNLMVGRYGGDDPVPLAAVSFGGSVFFILFIAAIGIALGMTPLVGELYAQGDREKSAGLLQNGILFYTLLGFAMAVVQYSVIPLMYRLGQPVDVVDAAIPYYRMLVFSMPFVMLSSPSSSSSKAWATRRSRCSSRSRPTSRTSASTGCSSTAATDFPRWAPRARAWAR